MRCFRHETGIGNKTGFSISAEMGTPTGCLVPLVGLLIFLG